MQHSIANRGAWHPVGGVRAAIGGKPRVQRLGGLRLWLWGWLCVGCALLAGCLGEATGLQTLAQAGRAPEAAPLAVEAITLPDSWNRQNREGLWRYHLAFTGPEAGSATSGEPPQWGLFIPRVGNRLRVQLNGQQIAMLGDFKGSRADYSNRPQFFYLPSSLLRPGLNDLLLEVQGERARYAGLSPVQVGPATALSIAHRWREAAQVSGSAAMLLVALVFAVISAALAWQQRSRPLWLFALACVCAVCRLNSVLLVEMPMDDRFWSLLRDLGYAGYLACLCAFSGQALGLRQRVIPWMNWGLLLASVTLIPWHTLARFQPARQLWLSVMVVYATVFAVLLILRWRRMRTLTSAVMAGAGAASLAIGLHDHVVVFYLPQGYAALVLVAYSLLLYLFAMAVLVADQQLQRLRQQDVQRLQAEHALHLRRQELERDFEDRQRQAGEWARQRERSRISQDLHDGLGSQLTGLLRQVEADASSPAAVALEVRTAIEQMRLLVHNADHFEGDVAMLLAQVKEVVERRLRQACVGLDWQVRLHRPERALAHAQAMALQHLVFELTTNTLKHAHATQVTVRVQDPPDTPAALFLSFADNGRGHPRMAGGAGSRSAQRRIDELGGRVVLADGQHGMRLDCEFPAPLFLPDPATSTGPGAVGGEPPQSDA